MSLTPMNLPAFAFRRDAASAFEASELVCQCCGQARGWINAHSPIYSAIGVDLLCPWCIADGSAAEKFQARFFDAVFCDDDNQLVELGEDWERVVFGQTPGFATYNPIGWRVHCGEPAEYVRREEPYELIFECCSCGKQHSGWDLD